MNVYDRIINILLESRVEDYLERLDEAKKVRNKDRLKDLYYDEGDEYEREHGKQYRSKVKTGKESLMADAAARRAMKGSKLPLPK